MDYNVQLVGKGSQVKHLLNGITSGLEDTGQFKLDLSLRDIIDNEK